MATEWFVGPIMEKLINSCSEYIEDQFRWQKGMKKELERLRENHPKIQAVVFAATEADLIDQNLGLNKWIWQLRDAIDEAEDVIDEFEYMKHKEELARNMEETKVRSAPSTFLFKTAQKFRKVGERALKIDPNLNRLEEVVQKLDKVSAEVGTFLHLLEGTKEHQQKEQLELYKTRETGSLPKNDLIGRVKDKEFVMQWLRQPTNEEHQTQITGTTLYNNISLLSIVGHGGMGKTTLLLHVYEDEMIKNFDLKMWVCVSNVFDVKKVIADILESLIKKKSDLESLDALQGSLKSAVMSKKFLLVLDDIWEEELERDKSKWEDVFAPLASGSLGSKILITTRMNSVASMIANVIKKKTETLRLKGLEKDDCLQLLNTHAFAGVDNIDDHKKLRSIAGEIVKKLSGSPLAAKVIGGALNFNLDERHWLTILNSDFRSAELGQKNIMPILRLSYRFLPKSLQSCFSFCCIFPQDHYIRKDSLVHMWIAMGFIQAPSNSRESMEDIGERYFYLLVNKSFFEVEYGVWYKMHDLLHELAQTVSAQEFEVVSDEELHYRIPETIRHLSVETNNLKVLGKMIKFKHVRSLFLSYKGNDQDFVNVITEIFKALRSIRLLYIYAPFIKEIPESIGYLIHLRQLNIAKIGATKLPRSLSNLYHLQFIIFYNSWYIRRSGNFFDGFLPTFSDDVLPSDMNNLSHLRYLKLPWNDWPIMIHGIGKLKSLQELDGFHVKNEAGYKIGELEHLNEIRLLRINHLENVKDVEDACNAKLCDKRNLTNLSLKWNHTGIHANPDLEEKVFDNLQPYKSLKKLYIDGYIGARSAIWMNNATLTTNLECIDLVNCMEWKTLPPFGQLPFLKSLCLSGMPKVKRIENKFHGNEKEGAFPSLKVLYIDKLGAMEDWFDEAAAANNCLFPCLTELHLNNCPNLQELPYLPPKLMKLMMFNIGWETLNCCSISKSIPLETLLVSSCPNIRLPADEIVRLAALRILRIQNCPNQISLGFNALMEDNINPSVLRVGGHGEVEATEKCQLMLSQLSIGDPSVLLKEPLRSIIFLQKMYIEKNDELDSFPVEAEQWFLKVSSSLHELKFIRLKALQSLPSTLKSLSSLKILRVEMLPQLQLLPNIPTSLEELWLDGLESLQCLPSLLTISSLKCLILRSIPLRELPCLLSLSFLDNLIICSAHRLQELPNLPPSLCHLNLEDLDNLNCMPSCLPSLSSLNTLTIKKVPQLRELLDIPTSLCELYLEDLDNLNHMPSCLLSLSSLKKLLIRRTPQLCELPNLPLSLEFLHINDCHPELMKRYQFSGSERNKIAHIPYILIS